MDKITKIILTIIILSSISLFGTDNEEEETNDMIPIIEVDGNRMPGWEKEIIERFHDEEGSAIPVIFRNAAKDWVAASWTPEYFAENFGDEIIIAKPQFSQGGITDQIPSNQIYTTFKDHINDITLNPNDALYFDAGMGHNNTIKSLNDVIIASLSLSENTQFPQSIPSDRSFLTRSYFVFIGSENTLAILHSHGSTFLAQLFGRKQAALIHPKNIDKCACTRIEGEEFTPACLIDVAEPNFEQHPDFKDVEIYHTILEPGDVLYIPHNWLHDIRALSRSITISSGF